MLAIDCILLLMSCNIQPMMVGAHIKIIVHLFPNLSISWPKNSPVIAAPSAKIGAMNCTSVWFKSFISHSLPQMMGSKCGTTGDDQAASIPITNVPNVTKIKSEAGEPGGGQTCWRDPWQCWELH